MMVLGLSLSVLAARGFGMPDLAARSLDPLGGALATVSALPLAARRTAPMAVYLMTAAASVALLGLHYPRVSGHTPPSDLTPGNRASAWRSWDGASSALTTAQGGIRSGTGATGKCLAAGLIGYLPIV
jgi:hypothetical protein